MPPEQIATADADPDLKTTVDAEETQPDYEDDGVSPEVRAKVEEILERDYPETADTAGEAPKEGDSPGEGEKAKKEEPEAKGDEPAAIEPDTLARAESAGLDKETAERFHKAGLLEDHLVAQDRRTLSEVARLNPPTDRGPQGEEGASAPAAAPRQPPIDPAGPKRDGSEAQETEAPSFDEDNLPEDFLKAHKWQGEQLAETRNELASLRAEMGELQDLGKVMHDQRQEEFDTWMDGQLLGTGDEDFGEGAMVNLPLDSEPRKQRTKVAKAYFGLCLAQGVSAVSHDGEILQRAYHAVFHDKIKKASQRKQQELLRGAHGHYISPTQPSSGKVPPPPQTGDDEEYGPEVLDKIEKIRQRGGGT